MDENSLHRFQNAINYQGFAFQYKIAEYIKSYLDPRFSIEATEFPIEINGNNSKIDIILGHLCRSWPHPLVYYIGECKRVNPALGNWLFVRSPNFNQYEDSFLFEKLSKNPENNHFHSELLLKDNDSEYYNLAFEVKTNETGDAYGSNHDAIENAATQVIRGTNGLIKLISRNIRTFDKPSYLFCPVIFTTAKLFASKIDLQTTDLHSGKIDLSSDQIEEKKWLIYQYTSSPSIKFTDLESTLSKGKLKDFPYQDYIRTIIITNPDGILEALPMIQRIIEF